MAKRKRSRSTPATARATSGSATSISASEREEVRRQRREAARRQREAAIRRRRRTRLLKRGLAWATVGLVVLGIAGYVFVRGQHARQTAAESRRVAAAAGCTDIETMPDRGATHIEGPVEYPQQPATSGSHGAPLPSRPRVYPAPVREENAVHNLEHGYVLVYHRADGDGPLSPAATQALASFVQSEDKVIMAPYPDLEPGRSLALVAWNKLQQCPGDITASQAVSLARTFVAQFRSDGEAPEPGAP